jgi:hypothetical protein
VLTLLWGVCGNAACAGKQVTPGELLTALEGAPLDSVYLDAAGQEKGASTQQHMQTCSGIGSGSRRRLCRR